MNYAKSTSNQRIDRRELRRLEVGFNEANSKINLVMVYDRITDTDKAKYYIGMTDEETNYSSIVRFNEAASRAGRNPTTTDLQKKWYQYFKNTDWEILADPEIAYQDETQRMLIAVTQDRHDQVWITFRLVARNKGLFERYGLWSSPTESGPEHQLCIHNIEWSSIIWEIPWNPGWLYFAFQLWVERFGKPPTSRDPKLHGVVAKKVPSIIELHTVHHCKECREDYMSHTFPSINEARAAYDKFTDPQAEMTNEDFRTIQRSEQVWQPQDVLVQQLLKVLQAHHLPCQDPNCACGRLRLSRCGMGYLEGAGLEQDTPTLRHGAAGELGLTREDEQKPQGQIFFPRTPSEHSGSE
jgi:hypothetical protein